MEEKERYDLAEFFKVFGDVTRLRILEVLSGQELCVSDLADRLGMGQSAVSHQLRLLKQLRLVRFRKDGKTVYYALNDDHIRTIIEMGLEHIREDR